MSKFKNKVLITGSQGQDGIILSDILIKKKYNVIGLVRNYNFKKKIPKTKYIRLSLFHKNKLKQFLKKNKPNFIVHFGSENPSYSQRNKNKNVFNKKNKISTLNLINCVNDLKLETNFIFANSSQIFKKTKKKINESFHFIKKDSYTSFRIDIYEYLKTLKKRNNFKFVNLILFNHDSIFRSKKFLFPRLINSIKRKDKKFINTIYEQNIFADFSHAEDICNAIYLIIKKSIIVDNLILSSSKLTSVNRIIRFLLMQNNSLYLLNKKNIIKRKEISLLGNNSLAKRILGWKIKKNIFKAVSEIYEY